MQLLNFVIAEGRSHAALAIALGWCLVAVMGCGGTGQRDVRGRVTIDGAALQSGTIAFRPMAGTTSPSAGAEIANGEYTIAAKGGLLPGSFLVEITAMRATGKKGVNHFTGETVVVEEQFIPAKYNSQSELQAVVNSAGPNEFNFTLYTR